MRLFPPDLPVPILRRSYLRRFTLGAGAVLAAGLLTACSGGSQSSQLGGTASADPVVVDFPIAYVRRPVLFDDNGDLVTSNVRDAADFFPGAELLIRDRASPSSAEIALTAGIFPDDMDGNPPQYDVKDLSASFDGTRLVFAMRAPEDPNVDEDEQPTWNIWLYDSATGEVRRVIESDITAEAGQDVAPRFLPDDRIVFSSTRQRRSKAVLLDEGKPQFAAFDEDRDDEAFLLHVMNDDGTDIHQITFNQSSDLDPAVLGDGRVVFSRWDNVNNISRISLYSVNPDGTNLQLLYGVHSHDTGPDGDVIEFTKPRELPDGRLLSLMRPPGDQSRATTVPVVIDTATYVDNDQPTFDNAGLLGPAQEYLIEEILSLDETAPVLAGRYASFSPLYDGTNRMVAAWSQCRLVDEITDPADPVIAPCTDQYLNDPNFVEADPLYGIWMFDADAATQLPIVPADEGEYYSDVVIMEPRVLPPVIIDGVPGINLDPDLVAESVGVVHIRNVYDFDGVSQVDNASLADPLATPADARPARFVRIVKAVSMPDDDLVDLDGTAFGRSQAQLMREVLGYAPIEPDGSVALKVPANVAFWLDILDADGRRVQGFPRHQNWLQLRPGEVFECNGCHLPTSEVPHGRLLAEAPSSNPGAPADGSPFPNTEPALFANAGETMAEVWMRINGARTPSVGLLYDDEWTDPNVRAKDPSFAYSYTSLATTPPVDTGCVSLWSALCRITINYETHIHPIWNVERPVLDNMGVEIGNNRCTTCHADVDDMMMPMIPVAQLDLSDGISDREPDHYKSYQELLFNDDEQTLDAGGNVVDLLVQDVDGNGNPLFVLDANGDPVLDANGQPIPVLVTISVSPSLNVAGANFSPRFFSRFASGGTHQGWLDDAELKLISEWIDIGGQYYNNPFDVPQ
ncbi:MAG: hypothetical protein AB7I04_12275 [Pseudomonadales bacterium]